MISAKVKPFPLKKYPRFPQFFEVSPPREAFFVFWSRHFEEMRLEILTVRTFGFFSAPFSG